jgi:hypothetical protein
MFEYKNISLPEKIFVREFNKTFSLIFCYAETIKQVFF